jgi:hypothetical protein
MELIHIFISPIYFKFSFVFLLFALHIYLNFTFPRQDLGLSSFTRQSKDIKVLQSGFNVKKLRGLLTSLVSVGGLLSALITIKNEFKSVQIGKLDQLMEADRTEIRKSIDRDREGHQSILTSIENSKEELLKLQLERANLIGQNDILLTLHNSIQNKVSIYQDKSMDPETKLSELGILDQLIKQDTSKFGEEIGSLILNIEPSLEEEGSINNTNDLKESSILNLDLFSKFEWFESLNGIKKLAVCLILGKSVVLSALISIVFIFYGNILIDKYDLENKYPKLAKIIQLRQKFQKYYFKYYCFLILVIIISEVAFALAILTL